MRVVGGDAKGRRLTAPDGDDTRPTSDRAREAMFSTLTSLGVELDGCRFLDLYAGSGAVGCEALSRGAAHVRFVEKHRGAARVIDANIVVVKSDAETAVVVASASDVLASAPDAPYDVVFADPPYALGDDELAAVLVRVADSWLASDGVVVVERASQAAEPPWPTGVAGVRHRSYGAGTLWYGRRAAPAR